MEKNGKNIKRGQSKKVAINPIAYVIEDAMLGKLEIKNSANAWWLDRRKVENLIGAWKIDASVEECRYKAGISIGQYNYFMEIHPNFSDIKVLCSKRPDLKARTTIYNSLDNPETAKWYLERKKRDEFGTKGICTSVQVNVGTEIMPDEKVNKLVEEFEEKLKNTYREEILKEYKD